MTETIFSGVAHIELQGDRALRLIDVYQDHADFEVIGFDEPRITLRDHRRVSLDALAKVLKAENVHLLALKLNTPAQANVQLQNSGDIAIELHETQAQDPAHRLWVAIGIQDRIPVYDYVFRQIAPLGDGRFAFLGLYRRNGQQERALSTLSEAV